MASTDHTQGVGFRPGRFGRGGFGAWLDGQRQADADNRWAIFVRPEGPDSAVVRNIANGQAYIVGNATGKTFTPGSAVLLGSNSGQRTETIIAQPPPGQAGQSAFPPQALDIGGAAAPRYRTSRGCPPPQTGRTYLALFYGDYAAVYEDGHFVRQLSPHGTLPAGPTPLQEATWRGFQWIAGDLVVFATDQFSDGKIRIHTWDANTGTDSAAEITATPYTISYTSAPLSIGGVNYFLGGRQWYTPDHTDSDMDPADNGNGDRYFAHLQLYSLPVGAAGPVTPTTVGPLYAPPTVPTPTIHCASVCSPGGGVFEFPSDLGPAIPSLASGTWSDGVGRTVQTEDGYFFNVAGYPFATNGQPISGGAALRVGGIIPAGKSEVLRTPAAWHVIWGNPASGMLGRVTASVAPSGDEYALYPVYDRIDPAGVDEWGQQPPGLLRLKTIPYPESRCGMPIIQVSPDPAGRFPDIMLARDF